MGNLRALQPARISARPKAFKTYEPGFVHVDVKYLPQMADEARRRYLSVAIDRATRSGFVALKADKTARSARAFLKALATMPRRHDVRQLQSDIASDIQKGTSNNARFCMNSAAK